MNMGAEQQATVKGGGGGSRFAAACGLLRQYQYMMGQGRGAAAMKIMGLFPQRPGMFNDTLHQRYAPGHGSSFIHMLAKRERGCEPFCCSSFAAIGRPWRPRERSRS
jgi:hypothetical protein